ncbi:MAG: hypothetical protein V1875_01155 [Candidatus Altiarchaeota archaeon]
MHKTRSGAFLHVLEALRVDGQASVGALMAATGNPADAKELIRLLADICFAEHRDGLLKATPSVNSKPGKEQFSKIEDYLFGHDEAANFRKIVSTLQSEHASPEHAAASAGHEAAKKEVDAETVKKYAKDFLDVSDIASKQRTQKVDK